MSVCLNIYLSKFLVWYPRIRGGIGTLQISQVTPLAFSPMGLPNKIECLMGTPLACHSWK